MSNEILDLPKKPKKDFRQPFLLIGAVLSYLVFMVFSAMRWPYQFFFVLLTAVFLIVFVIERFVSNQDKVLLDYWIFINVLLFILGLTLRSLKEPLNTAVFLVFIISAGLMFLFILFSRLFSKKDSVND